MYMYTVVDKKCPFIWTITPMFPGGFLPLFYQWKQERMLDKGLQRSQFHHRVSTLLGKTTTT